jgi:hypothetical protein
VHFRACAEHTSGNDVTSGDVTSFRSGPLPVTSLPVTHAPWGVILIVRGVV